MGIDYSTAMGYGYAVPYNQHERIAEIAGIDDSGDDLAWQEWLDHRGLDRISVALNGNLMDDEQYLLFYIQGTYASAGNIYEGQILTELDALPTPQASDMVQLSMAMEALEVDGPIKPGWKLFLNIS